MVPFAKTGGLADVVGALPMQMARAGHEVLVMIPHYGFLDTADYHIEPLGWSHPIEMGERKVTMTAGLTRDRKSGMRVCFIGNPHYFNRRGLYFHHDTKEDFADNDERFAFFSRSRVMPNCWLYSLREGKSPPS